MKTELLFTGILLTASLGLAHADHAPRAANCTSKGCTKEQIEAAVPTALEHLMMAGKIDSSWSTAKVEKVEQKQFQKGPEWVATLFDAKQKDQKKQRLYVFITVKGFVSGANHTGE